jgi:hypothetical protein
MTITNVRYDVMGTGHDAYVALLEVLGNCVPEVVGWCELDVDGLPKSALVVTQAWPRGLPLGFDPQKLIKAKKYAAVFPTADGALRVVEVPGPPGLVEEESRVQG